MKPFKKTILIISIIMVGIITTVGADGIIKKVEAFINPNHKITIDGEVYVPTEEDGTVVQPLIYNGRTYLPIRHIGEITGMKVEWNDETKTVVLKRNRLSTEDNILEIRLEENPTTGYTWHYTIEDESIIEIVSDEYKTNKTENQIVGAGGVHVWEIKGLKEGKTTIKFDLYRSWEGVENSVDTREYTIIVSPELEIKKVEGNMNKIKYRLINTVNNQELNQWALRNNRTRGVYHKNLDNKDYILISAGECRTGGYSIDVNDLYINQATPDTLYVDYTIQSPPRGSIVTQAITYPHVVLELDTEYNIENVIDLTQNNQVIIPDEEINYTTIKGIVKSIQLNKTELTIYIENGNAKEGEYDKAYITINATTKIENGKFEDIIEGTSIEVYTSLIMESYPPQVVANKIVILN